MASTLAARSRAIEVAQRGVAGLARRRRSARRSRRVADLRPDAALDEVAGLCGQEKNMKCSGMPSDGRCWPEPEVALLQALDRVDDRHHRRLFVVVARVDEQALREQPEADREHVGVASRSHESRRCPRAVRFPYTSASPCAAWWGSRTVLRPFIYAQIGRSARTNHQTFVREGARVAHGTPLPTALDRSTISEQCAP